MKVLVAGAHGKTARRLVQILTEDGREVRGLVRREEQMPDVEADGAEPVLVDLEEEEVEGAVGRAVEGCDAIVFAAGAGPGSGAARKETMDYGGAVKLVEAAEKHGVRRYLDYTIIRPGSLTEEEGAGKIEAAEVLGRRGEIPRDDVARTFAEALEMPNTYRKTFEIIGGETPIREALERI
jgi:uncharacterized protein YbjT (DUF2867 family)